MNTRPNPSRPHRAGALLLIALVALTFARVPAAEFVRWDDRFTLHQNPRLNPPAWRHVAAYWREWRTGEHGLYIPLTYTAWSALAAVGRLDEADLTGIALNPWVFHAASVGVHAIATLLVFQILLRLTRGSDARVLGVGSANVRDAQAPPADAMRADAHTATAALLGAAVFAVHPLQVEPVAWASGLKDLLAGMLALAAVLHYVTWAQSTAHQRPTWRLALATTLALLAMLSKPSAVVVAPICFALDVLLLRRAWRRALRGTAAMFLLALPIVLIARRAQDVTNLVEPLEFWKRPLVAADALAFYFRKLLWPANLGIDYGRTPQWLLARPGVWLASSAALALLAACLWLARRNRPLIAAAAIFVLALSPVLGLATFQFQRLSTVADHYVYVAMLGPALAVAWIVTRWPARVTRGTVAALVFALACAAFVQAGHWQNDFALLAHATRVNPGSAAAHNNLAAAHESAARLSQAYAAAEQQRGNLPAARQHLRDHVAHLRAAAEHFRRAAGPNEQHPDAMRDHRRITEELKGK